MNLLSLTQIQFTETFAHSYNKCTSEIVQKPFLKKLPIAGFNSQERNFSHNYDLEMITFL
jgi:hypothetical protein